VCVGVCVCVCVCVGSISHPSCTAHAPYYIVTCGLSGFTIFFHIISQMTWTLLTKLLDIKCVFLFDTKFV
jgi:hypothetical protein